jgi:hypothetical protein
VLLSINSYRRNPMLIAIFITLIIVAALGYALSTSRRDDVIADHPYNNLYNDASAARQDHLG